MKNKGIGFVHDCAIQNGAGKQLTGRGDPVGAFPPFSEVSLTLAHIPARRQDQIITEHDLGALTSSLLAPHHSRLVPRTLSLVSHPSLDVSLSHVGGL